MQSRLTQDFDIAALDAKSMQQRVHRELRMVRRRKCGEFALRVTDTADQLPGIVVEIGIEPRQHHRALRESADGVEEFRGGRHRSGRARRDHRAVVMRGQARSFRLDQKIAPRRGLDLLDFLEMSRPCLSRDLKEFERVLPVLVQLIRHQPVKRVPADAAGHHVVHQAREIARQCKGRCRAADDKRRRDGAPCPGRDEFCQRQPALEIAKLGRNVQRRRSAVLLGLFRERQFVFVDVAERDDARQHHRVGLQLIEKDFPRHASGAPGRQIERRLRQP